LDINFFLYVFTAGKHILPHPIPRVLEVESMVQFGNPLQYGVIKDIKTDPLSNEKIAEIEMVNMHKVIAS